MDTDTLVNGRMGGGKLLVDQLYAAGFEAEAIFWAKLSTEPRWYLRIVTPMVDTEGAFKAYSALLAVFKALPEPHPVDPFEVKLIGPSDRLAQNVLAIQEEQLNPKTSRREHFLDLNVEGFHLYPLPARSVQA